MMQQTRFNLRATKDTFGTFCILADKSKIFFITKNKISPFSYTPTTAIRAYLFSIRTILIDEGVSGTYMLLYYCPEEAILTRLRYVCNYLAQTSDI